MYTDINFAGERRRRRVLSAAFDLCGSQAINECQVDDSWLGLFGEAKIHVETLEEDIEMTTISNVVMDQAGFVGLIRRLLGMRIVLLSVRQVDVALSK